ncbi:MAG TPA: NCS2 family permease [Candidatus Limnocylindria bacterium]|jgi:AGZA family xanthine/uracil permease-like MFS transporter|nr:NCS2 family permease [Candidatus Limnocylindria bacterium]
MASRAAAMGGTTDWIERQFKVRAAGSTIGTEIRGGLTNYLVMSYILVVNASILSAAGVPFDACVGATALMAALFTGAMALYANYPYAGAAGLGINAVVAFGLVKGAGLSWQGAMGVVALEGIAICIAMALGVRRTLLDAVPVPLKIAIGAGIGAFIFAIGAFEGGLVMGTGDVTQAHPLDKGNLNSATAIVTLGGLLLTAFLYSRGVKGSLILGIIGATVVGILVNAATSGATYKALPGVAVMPTDWARLPDFSIIGAVFTTGPSGLALLEVFRLGFFVAILTVFSLMLSDFFDTAGTVVSVAAEGGWLKKDGTIDRADRVFWVDSLGAFFGGIFGTSSNTTYIESGAGVAEGAKTGLASLVTAVLFLFSVFLAPIAGIVPPQATAPVLMLVGWFMFRPVLDLNKIGNIDFATGFAALLVLFLMPLTYSITNGIGAGFIAYSLLKVASGKTKDVSIPMWVATAAFAIYFADPWLRQFLPK